MTRKTNQTRTTIYRRHAGRCPIKGQPNNVTECECPLWIHGKVRGKFLRASLDTRILSTAERRRADLEAGRDDDPTPGGGLAIVGKGGKPDTLAAAAAAYLKTIKGLAQGTQDLYTQAIEHFCAWAKKQELELLSVIDSSHIREYLDANAAVWMRSTSQQHLVNLRVFFNYCAEKRWIPFPPTKDRTLNRRSGNKEASPKRTPFTPPEVTLVLDAVERMPEADRDRARALIYLLLYTGMRISDATFCERVYLQDDGNMDYHVIKTRKQIALPPELNERAIAALKNLPASRVYFFQPDREDNFSAARRGLRHGENFASLMPQFQARIDQMTDLVKAVLKLAGIQGTCHKFRDTFAINMLVGDGEKCADIYTVSKMLGHSDVRITDQHYMKLVKGYRERMSKMTRVLAYQFPKAG